MNEPLPQTGYPATTSAVPTHGLRAGSDADQGLAPELLAIREPSSFVGVPFLVAAVRRRRWALLACVLLGLTVALAFSLLSPPGYAASTVALLRQPRLSDPTAITSDALLAQTRTVAQRAIDTYGLDITARKFVKEYRAVVLSSDLLKFRATAPTARVAIKRSEAIASAFISFRNEQVQQQARGVTEALESRRQALQAELATVKQRIVTVSSQAGITGDNEVTELGDLLSRRASVSTAISDVSAQIEALAIDTDAVTTRSKVVDGAGEEDRGALVAMIRNLFTGVIGGLLVGGTLLVTQAVSTNRLRRRDDVMEALAVPVTLSLGATPKAKRPWQRFGGRRRPPPAITRLADHLNSTLENTGPKQRTIAVISVQSDYGAVLALASLAKMRADGGAKVLAVDLTDRSVLSKVLGVRRRYRTNVRLSGATGSLELLSPLVSESVARPVAEIERLVPNSEIVLVLATLHPSAGAYHLAEWTSTAVAVVTAGRSTAVALRSVARMCQLANVRLDSAVLLGADADDETLGVPFRPARTLLDDPIVWGDR